MGGGGGNDLVGHHWHSGTKLQRSRSYDKGRSKDLGRDLDLDLEVQVALRICDVSHPVHKIK